MSLSPFTGFPGANWAYIQYTVQSCGNRPSRHPAPSRGVAQQPPGSSLLQICPELEPALRRSDP